MFTRLLTVLALATTVLVPAAQTATPAGPAGLYAFLLRTDEPATDSFARTPSFGWTPYDTARSYEPVEAAAGACPGAPGRAAVDHRQPVRQAKLPEIVVPEIPTTPVYTATTSMLLDGLAPGIWYYRIRGIDPYVPGPIKQMTWSAPAQFKLVKPTFLVQNDVTTKRVK